MINKITSLSGLFALVSAFFCLFVYFVLDANNPLSKWLVVSEIVFCALFSSLWVLGGGLSALKSSRGKRLLIFSSATFIYSVLFCVVVLAAAYISTKKEFFFLDLTTESVHTFSPEVKEVINKLDKPVEVLYFKTPPSSGESKDNRKKYERTKLILERLGRENSNVKWEVLDPDKHLALVQKLRITDDSTLYLSTEGEKAKRWGKISGDIDEGKIFNGLRRLISENSKIIYVPVGFGEGNLSEEFLTLQESIISENIDIRFINLATDNLPKGETVLVIAPKSKYPEELTKNLVEFLKSGGNALILDEPFQDNSLPEVLREVGVGIAKDVIVRPSEEQGVVNLDLAIEVWEKHPITDSFFGNVIVATTETVTPLNDNFQALGYSPFGTWGETNKALLTERPSKGTKDENESSENLPFAVASTLDNKTLGRVVVIGDSDFVAYRNLNLALNKDFFLNSLHWVLGETEQINIRPKNIRQSVKQVPDETIAKLFAFTGVLLPQIIIMLGTLLWWRRSR